MYCIFYSCAYFVFNALINAPYVGCGIARISVTPRPDQNKQNNIHHSFLHNYLIISPTKLVIYSYYELLSIKNYCDNKKILLFLVKIALPVLHSMDRALRGQLQLMGRA